MITRKLKSKIQAAYKRCLTDLQYREWHANDLTAHEAVRQMAIGKPERLNDGRVASLLYDRHELPGDFGQTWARGMPTSFNAPFAVARTEFKKILAIVAKAGTINETAFDAYAGALAAAGIPPAVAHRFAAACFPTQLSAVVVDAEMNALYRKLAADNATAPTARTWFEKNTIATEWIKEALPGTDAAWRSLVAWRLH